MQHWQWYNAISTRCSAILTMIQCNIDKIQCNIDKQDLVTRWNKNCSGWQDIFHMTRLKISCHLYFHPLFAFHHGYLRINPLMVWNWKLIFFYFVFLGSAFSARKMHNIWVISVRKINISYICYESAISVKISAAVTRKLQSMPR